MKTFTQAHPPNSPEANVGPRNNSNPRVSSIDEPRTVISARPMRRPVGNVIISARRNPMNSSRILSREIFHGPPKIAL